MNRLIPLPVLARCLPFALFMVLLAVRGQWPTEGVGAFQAPWVYGVGVAVVGAALVLLRHQFAELGRGTGLTWGQFGLAVVLGYAVFKMWTALDEPWMRLGEPAATFRPVDAQGELIWSLVAVRWLGATLMVPVMEELFWRSFLMRWVDDPDFRQVDPRRASPKAVVVSAAAFATVHDLWLAAFLTGLVYAWLYRRTGKLWAPVVAHAVTNGVLGVWVVVFGAWGFW